MSIITSCLRALFRSNDGYEQVSSPRSSLTGARSLAPDTGLMPSAERTMHNSQYHTLKDIDADSECHLSAAEDFMGLNMAYDPPLPSKASRGDHNRVRHQDDDGEDLISFDFGNEFGEFLSPSESDNRATAVHHPTPSKVEDLHNKPLPPLPSYLDEESSETEREFRLTSSSPSDLDNSERGRLVMSDSVTKRKIRPYPRQKQSETFYSRQYLDEEVNLLPKTENGPTHRSRWFKAPPPGESSFRDSWSTWSGHN